MILKLKVFNSLHAYACWFRAPTGYCPFRVRTRAAACGDVGYSGYAAQIATLPLQWFVTGCMTCWLSC